MNLIGFLISAALSYCVAAIFSENISMNLSETVWDSGWTYAAWATAQVSISLGIILILSIPMILIAASVGKRGL